VQVRSLGFRTDLMLRRLAGASVDDRGDHIVVRTQANPGFYWGNFLLIEQPPASGEAGRWLEIFHEAFPDAGHVAIGIDGVDGDTGEIDGLLGAGMDLELSVVLTALEPAAAEHPWAEVRRLRSDTDWQQAIDVRLAVDDDQSRRNIEFVTRRAAESRALVENGHGTYVGAVVDGVVRATLGIVTDGSGLGRYQSVETHPDHRRKGLASTLLAAAADIARNEHGVDTFVIVADPDYVAIDLYRGLGFHDAERQVQLQRPPD